MSVWGLYPLPRSSSVPTRGTLIQVHNMLLHAREGRVPLPRALSVPTPRDALPAAVSVRGACTSFRECRLYRPRGTLVSVRSLRSRECVGPVPPHAV